MTQRVPYAYSNAVVLRYPPTDIVLGSGQKLLRTQGNAARILTVKASGQARLTLLEEDPKRLADHSAMSDA